METTWYKISKYLNRVMTVQVRHQSEQFITVWSPFWEKEQKVRKITDHAAYYPSFDEAKATLIEWREKTLELATNAVTRAQADLQEVTKIATSTEEAGY